MTLQSHEQEHKLILNSIKARRSSGITGFTESVKTAGKGGKGDRLLM